MLTRYLRARTFRLSKFAAVMLIFSAVLSHAAAASNEQHFSSGNVQATLVELFTSQGCSSCPPAERWLGDLKNDPRLWKEIIPVAFHVDYWDYIGWRDIYANPEYSARQRRYRSENGIRSVYTPGFVVNGQEWRGWFQKQSIPLEKNGSGQLQVTLNGNQLKAIYTATQQTDQVLNLHIALLGVGLQVDVERGENSGRRLSQDFTVLQLITLASSDGSWVATLPDIKISGDARPAIATWVSRNKNQRPLQAVGGWLAH